MFKLPKLVLILIFIFMCALLFCVVFLVRLRWGNVIEMSEDEFYFVFGIVSFISFISGISFIGPFKSWTPGQLIDRMENQFMINSAIIKLQERKAFLRKDLDIIPDPVQVIIKSHGVDDYHKDVKTEKELKDAGRRK